MKLTKRKGFNFFRSYFDVYNELENNQDKVDFIEALLNRQFLGEKPTNLKGMAKFAYISQTNSIDSQVKGYEDKTKTTLSPLDVTIATPTVPPTDGGQVPPSLQVEGEGKGKGKGKEKDKKEASFNFLKSIIDLGVEEQVAKDWMVVRKGKGANTLTAFKKIKEEIEACSATPNECITLSAQRGWIGFFAEYYKNSKVGSKQAEVSDDEKAFAENMGIIKGGTYIWKKFPKTKTW